MEKKISIIIPIYNEEDMLHQYPEKLFPVVDSLIHKYNIAFEIVLVDDGSIDRSLDIMRSFQSLNGYVVATRNEKNEGMGAALKRGVNTSSGDLLIFMDADLTFRPEDISRLLDAYLENPVDCVSGSPYLNNDSMSHVHPFRKALSRTVNVLYCLELGKKVTSISPIFRLYRRDVFRHIVLESNNFEINAEIIAKIIFQGMSVKEVPADLYNREFGSSKARLSRTVLHHVRILWKIFGVRFLNKPWA